MDRSRYKQAYGDFIGVDLSSDPSAVSRNRLAWSVNMWRDYESANGGCVETFPGYRAVARLGERVNGLYNYRTMNGINYLIVHSGRDLYAFTATQLAAYGGVLDPEVDKLLTGALENNASTGYLFNNNLYVLDGTRILEIKTELSEVGIESLTAGEIVGYIPTTYYDGKPYEQRNMLSEYAYETVTNSYPSEKTLDYSKCYSYSDEFSEDHMVKPTRKVKGVSDGYTTNYLNINAAGKNVSIERMSFQQNHNLKTVNIIALGQVSIDDYAFFGCEALERIDIHLTKNEFSGTAFLSLGMLSLASTSLKSIRVFSDDQIDLTADPSALPNGINIEWFGASADNIPVTLDRCFEASDIAKSLINVINEKTGKDIHYAYSTESFGDTEESNSRVSQIYISNQELLFDDIACNVKAKFEIYPNHFSAIAGADNFLDGNLDYKKTGAEAINGCTKCAVFDGRVFLTGNRELPNTVFYNQRNLTGASDPTYFGAYNYINDGVGNVPNVELLATPSYLMVLKQDTVQDGSIYYHTPADNTHSDQVIRNLLPRIYPSISGAAGIGSAGDTVPGATVCNFLDDPVFLSKRGLSAVEKQQVNLERSIARRSGNVDRLLIKEDLAHAALAEWKGYLLILVNGNVYMADSRALAQHPDGSYQYEWFYLTGIGAWESYAPQYRYCTAYPVTDDGIELAESQYNFGRLADTYKISKIEGIADGEVVSAWAEGTASDGTKRFVEFFTVGEYLVEQIDDELRGEGVFHGADKMAVVGERLFFGTTNGYLLCVNSDMRDDEGIIPRDAYTFNGCAYESGCATRLDDCGQMGLAKCTVPGTVVAEFKMIPGSRCRINVSLNGRDFRELFSGAVGSTRFDFGDLDFSNFAFTENESNITVLREMTRNFVRKQYYIYSDGYKEPFGLCGLTYQYYVKGKIRR